MILIIPGLLLTIDTSSQAQPDTPEFLRILNCSSGDRDRLNTEDSVAVSAFWFVGRRFSVPANRTETLLHRSGKIISVCEGSYDIDQLRVLVSSPSPCSRSKDAPTDRRGCPRVPVPHIPKLTTHRKSFVYGTDSIVIYLKRPAEVKVHVTDIFGEDYASFTRTSDSILVPVRLDGYKEASQVILNSLNSYDEITLLRPGKKKTSAMDKLIADLEKQTSNASASFRQISRAYLLGANGYELEALMILRELQNENKGEVFFEEAYSSLRDLLQER